MMSVWNFWYRCTIQWSRAAWSAGKSARVRELLKSSTKLSWLICVPTWSEVCSDMKCMKCDPIWSAVYMTPFTRYQYDWMNTIWNNVRLVFRLYTMPVWKSFENGIKWIWYTSWIGLNTASCINTLIRHHFIYRTFEAIGIYIYIYIYI